MKESVVDNSAGLTVYINGEPDLRQMPKDEYNLLITALTQSVTECIRKEKEKIERANCNGY